MYVVTPDYQQTIYSNNRKIYGRVTFDISPVGIEDDTPTVTTSSEFAISMAASQITDNIRQNSRYLVSYETNRTTLGGLFTFPSDNSSEWGEVGWVSNNVSSSFFPSATLYPSTTLYPSGYDSPSITLTFANTYTSAGITVTFDALFNEYATSFTITAYDAANAVILSYPVTGNTLVQYALVQQIIGFKKITVQITGWSTPYRRPKILEIDAGVVLVYENDRLVRMNSTEELDPLTSTLVIPEFSFTVDNSNGEFDILNPTGIYASLQLRQRIQAEYGLELTSNTEWIPMGIYYLSEWRSDSGAMTATFRGRSKLDLLESTNYENLSPKVSYTLYDMAVDVLAAAGITGYSIDIGLDSIPTNGLISNSSCKTVLQMIAMAGTAMIYVTRKDVLTIAMYTPLNAIVDSVYFSAMKEEPQIELGKAVDSVSVNYYTNLTTIGGIITVTNANVIKGEVISLSDNTLINTSSVATNVANWLNDRRSEAKEFTINFRGNPAYELNDYLAIENRYTTNQYMYVTKIDTNYEGYLYSQIKGKAAN